MAASFLVLLYLVLWIMLLNLIYWRVETSLALIIALSCGFGSCDFCFPDTEQDKRGRISLEEDECESSLGGFSSAITCTNPTDEIINIDDTAHLVFVETGVSAIREVACPPILTSIPPPTLPQLLTSDRLSMTRKSMLTELQRLPVPIPRRTRLSPRRQVEYRSRWGEHILLLHIGERLAPWLVRGRRGQH